VVDSILVIVFGGALAAKIYQHLSSPAIVTAAPAAHRRPAPASAPALEAPKPAPAPAPEAKAPEPAPAAPTAGPKAAKPSLLAEPMKGRATPKAQAAGPASASVVPSGSGERQPSRDGGPMAADKRHSIPVEFKLKASHARSVQLAGAFIVRGGRREMVAQDEGVWTLTLYLLPGTNYRYWFLVNGKKTLDPENHQVERGASVLVLP
jgi:hypothetical protein